jgi:pectinesterase
VYLECWMDAHIAPEGWDEMNYAARDGTRVPLRPSEARLFEYRSSGPGAHADPRRRTPEPRRSRAHAPRAVLADWTP